MNTFLSIELMISKNPFFFVPFPHTVKGTFLSFVSSLLSQNHKEIPSKSSNMITNSAYHFYDEESLVLVHGSVRDPPSPRPFPPNPPPSPA